MPYFNDGGRLLCASRSFPTPHVRPYAHPTPAPCSRPTRSPAAALHLRDRGRGRGRARGAVADGAHQRVSCQAQWKALGCMVGYSTLTLT